MNPVYSDVVDLLTKGQPVVLARIIRQTGSAPRSVGTACLVLADGTVKGTIGGGALEYQVSQKATEVIQSRESALLEFRLTGSQVAESEMLCGGLVDVYLEPLVAQNVDAFEVFKQVQQLLSAGRKGALVTRIAVGCNAEEPDQRALIRPDGSTVGGLIDRLSASNATPKDLLATKEAGVWGAVEGAEDQFLFIEPLKPDSVLFLFGAGHVSTFVAPLAALAGFKVVLIDDREEFANSQRFPQADEIIVSPISEAFEKIDINAAAFIAIITRGHTHDHEVLEAALKNEPAYIGMIGSLRKRNLIYRSLMEKGISAQRLSQVHSPIGLDIGAETPEEIAVSIVAELIHVRALTPVSKTPFEGGAAA